MIERAQLSVKKPEANRENKVSQIQKTELSQSVSSPIDQILFLQRTIGNQAVGRLIKSGALQAKLRIGSHGDVYEEEADRVAEQVMRLPESTAAFGSAPHIQRACPLCEEDKLRRQPIEEEEEELRRRPSEGEEKELQTKPTSGNIPEVQPDIESHIQSLKGEGQPLSENDRAFFEPRFGRDFSQVRVHTNEKAAKSARAVNARAFTVGRDVVFGTGQYALGISEGQRLLAHELTHVVQQQDSAQMHTIQRSPGPKEDLEKKFKISLETGDKAWSASDLADLQWTLSKLNAKESDVLAGYKFLRWSTPEKRREVDPAYTQQKVDECGLHEANLKDKTYKISMYDKCFDKSTTIANVPVGKFHILHEIGHAMEVAELRKAWEIYDKVLKEYNAAIDAYNSASPDKQKKLKPNIDKLDRAVKTAKAKLDAAEKRTISEFEKLVKNKPELTEYSKTNAKEAFAEAFALYKINPKGIKEKNPKLANWFEKHGHLNPLK